MASTPSAPSKDDRLDLPGLEAKWHRLWQERKVYEADPEPGRPKFFCTYPYSYMNAYAHIGHAYTMLRVDFMARYQRMLGKNVLFPFAYHVTGTPIVAAAGRIRDHEPKQIAQLIDQGIPAEEVPKFADPLKWVEFFPQQWRQDVDRLGLAIDWRRQFHTTDINPYYDSFIRWQFRKLRELGYVRKGRHPVVWDPTDNAVLSDHDRTEGEGVTPQEYTLIKLRDAGDPSRVLVAATLRPETMFGQTNVWVNPEETYTELAVGDERWVVAASAAEKFPFQFDCEPTGVELAGTELVGLEVLAPTTDRRIPVLPASFVSARIGTGVVTSVPSDAPDDHRALLDLQEDEEALARHGLDPGMVRALAPIPIIDTPGLGDLPGPTLIEEWGIQNQTDRDKLVKAKEEVYKRGFYEGVMKPDLPLVGGKPVQEAKELVKAHLVAEGEAALFWELTERVVSRSLTEAVVKVVDDQWFMGYGEEDWKTDVRRAFAETVRCYPAKVRTQFDNVVDWLNDWACARASGLGTHLPWDEQWIIESLSDSTIYMAYYTVAHILEAGDVAPEDIRDNDAAFDYVFLGKGSKSEAVKGTLTEDVLEEMRAEFDYWYPLDYRNSGKDLVQNHLTFMVYNHVAIFPREHWPRGISVNGWVTVDGEKMSKSAGNFVTLRESLGEHGATLTRLTLANAGEGLDDANFDREFARSMSRRVEAWYEAVTRRPEGMRDGDQNAADRWLLARLAAIAQEVDTAYEGAFFRSALKAGFFDLTRAWSWYQRRALGEVHEDVFEVFSSTAVLLLAPIAPALASEAWTAQGREGDVLDATFPRLAVPEGAEEATEAEALVERVLEDVRDILKVTGAAPKRVRMFVAPAWKATVLALANEMNAAGERVDPGSLTPRAMQVAEVKAAGGEAAKFAKDLAIRFSKGERPTAPADEHRALASAKAFLAVELGCPVEVHRADEHAEVEDGGKAKRAEPGRPGIFVET